MAIAATATMSQSNENAVNNIIVSNNSSSKQQQQQEEEDEHEQDMVMPGFRFHPTEEELVEFYLRRKVEGKRFNVELITFLDLYRYDPWELPALAAIGEKEWFFYVPRDRKYRNGDRPNRVTTSGYWKATGADRMIRTENSRSIGLKKTLVFYSGKAPKGIRTSWIMNEYRLPHHETERYQKAEISLCRVYKRAGVEDHPSLPRSLPSRASSSSRSSGPHHHQQVQEKKQHSPAHQFPVERTFQPFVPQSQHQHQAAADTEKLSLSETDGSCSSSDVTTALGLSKHNNSVYHPLPPISTSLALIPPASSLDEDPTAAAAAAAMFLHHSTNKQNCPPPLVPAPASCNNHFGLAAAGSSHSNNPVDDLHRLVNYQQACTNMLQQQPQYHHGHNYQHPVGPSQFPSNMALPSQPLPLNMLPGLLPSALSERLWEWNQINPDHATRDYNPFK
ncbi:hypothetical protein Tsubulata_010301 [Turnera subulata]|uniref:NAC domain-containing protein n=1 Tax=Turnera subulata TaxID=218843 RepID=A0A9Q0GBY9_9ROSI|nr:hypothetical protein Tsubulata_010301 [Turnera subulata]